MAVYSLPPQRPAFSCPAGVGHRGRASCKRRTDGTWRRAGLAINKYSQRPSASSTSTAAPGPFPPARESRFQLSGQRSSWFYMTVLLQALGRREHVRLRVAVQEASDRDHGPNAWQSIVGRWAYLFDRHPREMQWESWDYVSSVVQESFFESENLLFEGEPFRDHVMLALQDMADFASRHHSEFSAMWAAARARPPSPSSTVVSLRRGAAGVTGASAGELGSDVGLAASGSLERTPGQFSMLSVAIDVDSRLRLREGDFVRTKYVCVGFV
jgi:hypothetical protein